MLGRFLSWWLTQITGLVPAALRRRRRLRRRALCIAVEPDRIRVRHRNNRRVRELGEAPVDVDGEPSADDGERLRALAADVRPEGAPCEITVAPGLALVKEVDLPAAAQENLRQVIGFEMQRLTPFSTEEVYYDYAVTGRHDNVLRVQLAVVPRRLIDRATAWLPSRGLQSVPESPGGFRPAPLVASDGSITLDFRDPSHRETGGRGLYAVLLAVNVALAGTAIAIPLVQEQHHLDEAKSRLEEVRHAAEATAELRGEVERLRTRARFLAAAANARISTVVLIEELTSLLPDTTWVFRLELREGTVHLHGSSADAASLIATIDSSAMLSNVRFTSSVLREGTGQDRFHIAADVVIPGGGE